MAEVASAFVSIVPSARGFGKSLDSQVSGDINKSGKTAGKRFGSAMKGGALAVLGGAAIVGSLLKDSIGEAREAQKVGALTESIIKSTGGAAGVTAKQVGDMAGRLSSVTGIDDEVIQQGSNLLLTFKNVKNYVDGEFVGVFDRATAAAVDLSAAGFGSVDGSAKMLGKALNDPLKGISALGRAGVTFTEDQQKLIKSLVEGGDSAKAQGLILKEVESQVGGAGAAQATAGEKAAVAWGNLKEELGTKLLPVVDKVMTFIANVGIPAVSDFMNSLGKGTPIIQKVGNFVRTNLLPPIQDLAGWVMNSLVPAIQDFARDALPGVKSALESVKKGLSNAKPFFEFLGNVVTEVLLPVLGKLAKTTLPLIGDAVEKVGKGFGILGRLGTALWNKALQPAFKFIVNAIASILDMWSSMLGTLAKVPGFGWAKKAADAMGNAADKAREVADGIKKIPTSKTVTITTIYMTRNAGKEGRNRDIMGDPLGRLAAGSGGKSAFNKVLASLGKSGQSLMDRIATGIKTAKPRAVKAAQEAFDALKAKLETKRDDLRSVLDGLRDDFAGIRDSVAGAFAGNLFDVSAVEADEATGTAARTVGQAFFDNLMGKKAQLTGLLSSFKTLTGWGIDPAFLTQLFSSGNGALITELAGMGQAGAVANANLFGEVTNLSNQLGTAVATNDPVASRIDETNRLLTEAVSALGYLGSDIGKELNSAAAKAQRGKKGKGRK